MQSVAHIDNCVKLEESTQHRVDPIPFSGALRIAGLDIAQADQPFDLEMDLARNTAFVQSKGKVNIFGKTIDGQATVETTENFRGPFAVWLGGANGPGSVMFSVSAPTSATTLRLYWMSAFDPAVYGDAPVDGASLQAVEDRIWAPDQNIVESQRPAQVFAAAESHRAFDALGVAYRKALHDLGFAG